MISLALPAGLLGLLALPAIVWLHRRRRRAVPVTLPSLMFLEAEPATDGAPERVRLDRELVLGLVAAGCLALAAAGPSAAPGRAGRTVRVLVDTGGAMAARGADGRTASDRAEEAVERIRGRLGPEDLLLRVDGPAARSVPRSAAGPGALRLVVSDRHQPALPPGVREVLVGDGAAANVGLVAVDVVGAGAERRLFATLWNDGPAPARRRVHAGGATREVLVPAAGAASFELPWPAADPDLPIELVLVGAPDALAADDRVRLDPAPVLAGFASPADGLPQAHARAVRRALDAVAPGAWREASTGPGLVWFGPAARAPAGTALVVELHAVPAGAAPVRAPAGAPVEPTDAELTADLDPTGCELVYAPALGAAAPFPLVRRRARAGEGPVVLEWMPDPLLGAPAPVDHPIWPLFVDDAVALARGRAGPAGMRVRGLLDLEATRLGHDVLPFDPAWLDAAPRDRVPRETPLCLPLVGLGAVLLVLLWLAPQGRPDRRVG